MPYISIYSLTMNSPQENLIVSEGDIRITLTSGPLSFSYSVPLKRFMARAASMTMGKRQINLPSGSYIMIELLMKSFEDSERERVALAVAEVASLISLHHPHLLDEKLYEGIITPLNKAVIWSEGPFSLTASPSITPETVTSTFHNDFSKIQKLDANDRIRLQLAARWFRRGHEALNQVDKFLFWWTVLEIYPAKGTTHVARETANLLQLSTYTKMNTSEIKRKLELGPMHSMRGNIVHKGQAFVEDSERSIFERRLEKLCATATVCLRLLARMSPGDDLEQFIK
ncbi:hypothetical protein ACFLTP_01870 [Chloroflexota bacterium]